MPAQLVRLLHAALARGDQPGTFLARIIWQESRFDPFAHSRAGAQGIAQFMPKTAAWRGLVDPFDPLQAIPEAASYLRKLNQTFGNLGLAAAAYNAGPGRLSKWLSGRSSLPAETTNYVLAVTRKEITNSLPQWEGTEIPAEGPCEIFDKIEVANAGAAPQPHWAEWGAQLSWNWKEGELLATFERLRRQQRDILADKDPLIVIAYGPSE